MMSFNIAILYSYDEYSIYLTVRGGFRGFLGFPETPFGLDFTQTEELTSC